MDTSSVADFKDDLKNEVTTYMDVDDIVKVEEETINFCEDKDHHNNEGFEDKFKIRDTKIIDTSKEGETTKLKNKLLQSVNTNEDIRKSKVFRNEKDVISANQTVFNRDEGADSKSVALFNTKENTISIYTKNGFRKRQTCYTPKDPTSKRDTLSNTKKGNISKSKTSNTKDGFSKNQTVTDPLSNTKEDDISNNEKTKERETIFKSKESETLFKTKESKTFSEIDRFHYHPKFKSIIRESKAMLKTKENGTITKTKESETLFKTKETEIINPDQTKPSQSPNRTTLKNNKLFKTKESETLFKTKETEIINPDQTKPSQNPNRTTLKTKESETLFKTKETEIINPDQTEPSQSANRTTLKNNKRQPYSCQYCSTQVNFALTLESHTKENHPKEKMLLKCNTCDVRTKNLRNLYLHLNTSHGNTEGRIKCPHCDFIDYSTDLINKHKKKMHPVMNSFKCGNCDKVFDGRTKLKKHHGTCGMDVEEPAVKEKNASLCEVCGKMVKVLTMHKREHFVREFKCKHCTKKFTTSEKLEEHGLSHDKNGNLRCKICGESFKKKKLLELHVRIVHRGLEAFKCSKCDYETSMRWSLKFHVDTVHNNVAKFSCQLCGRGFTNSTDVKQHMVVHTKEQPFGCKLCDKRYTQAHALRTHMKTKH